MDPQYNQDASGKASINGLKEAFISQERNWTAATAQSPTSASAQPWNPNSYLPRVKEQIKILSGRLNELEQARVLLQAPVTSMTVDMLLQAAHLLRSLGFQ